MAHLVSFFSRALRTSTIATRRTMPQLASFSTTRPAPAQNQVFSPIRNADTFYSHLLSSSSSRIPLITLWTASWCPTCEVVAPLVRSVVESGVGEAEGGVAFATVEFDAPDIMSGGLAMQYMITALPTLLSFDAQEAQTQTKVVDGRRLADRRFVEEWIRNEALRHGDRGGGEMTSLFGGLFGGRR